MKRNYHLTYHLVEGEEQNAKNFCDGINKGLNAYARKKYPATYHPYTIKNNDHKGNDWNGWLCWYRYATC